MKITSFFFFLLLSFQFSASGIDPQASGKISGKVVDLSTGETLIGVPVLIQGTSFSTVTDLDGKFSIAQLHKAPTLFYSVMLDILQK
ncbi:MAG: carboxypeptidase-like regulatory domain-containing protein [Bacteroidetes bacterium]|nr:carboxypeptidase-like regulatory domain-containing protein [Bacteroidota bacterium]